MARTPMAHLSRLFRTRSWVLRFFPITLDINIYGIITDLLS